MIEDDQTVEEMRRAVPRERSAPKVFMTAMELRATRCNVLRVTQARLAEQLIDPDDGRPVSSPAISLWESSKRPIPLWVARRIRDLSEAARRYDTKKGEGE